LKPKARQDQLKKKVHGENKNMGNCPIGGPYWKTVCESREDSIRMLGVQGDGFDDEGRNHFWVAFAVEIRETGVPESKL